MTEGDIAPVLGPIGSLVEHAYGYAGFGLEVFPVNPRDKTPLTSQHQATVDLDVIEAWWSQWPEALIGHRTAEDVVILDIDPRHGGLDTWAALKAQIGDAFPVTRVHYSGRGDGGGHAWWIKPDDHLTITKLDAWARERGVGQEIAVDGAKSKWVCGIDILRRNHRYSILPPSLHPETGQPYTWAPGRGLTTDVAPMPQLLVDLLVRDAITPPPNPSIFRNPDSPADWYSDNTNWSQLLERHGWLLVGGNGESDGSRWRHPRSENRAHSATITHDLLFVYSPNTPFDVTSEGEPNGYTRFRAWATLEHGGDMSAAARAARLMMPNAPSTEASNGHADKGGTSARRLVLTPAASIKPRRVKWCWEGRLAVGTLGLLAGPEGLGKSTLGYTVAADLTRGTLRGEFFGQPKAVLVCATEDSWAHTIVPRLMAAGADLGRMYRAEVMLADDIAVGLSLPLDLIELEAAALDVEAAMLMLDPLMSRLDGVLDTHRDADVRRALEPLVSVADNTNMSILGLIHHNKSGSVDPLNLVMASKAFTAVARSVHTVIKDPDDETGLRRFFGTPKNNLGRTDLPTLSFTIESWGYDTLDGPGSTGRLAWGVEYGESIADILMRSARDPSEKSALDEAANWLEDYLSDRQMQARAGDAIAAGKAAGHAEKTIQRARTKLGIETSKTGYQGAWVWTLPNPPKPPPRPQDSELGALTSLAPSGSKEVKSIKEDKGVSPRAREAPLEPESEPEILIPADQIEASDAYRRGTDQAAEVLTIRPEDL